MKHIPPVAQLKTMLALHEKRAAIQSNLDAIDSQLSRLQAQLGTGSSSPVAKSVIAKSSAVKSAAQAGPKRGPRAKRGSSGRGELKAKIFAALHQAGKAGVKVQPLAAALGTKAANIY